MMTRKPERSDMNKKNIDKVSLKKMFSNNIFAVKLLFESTPIYGTSIIIEAIRHNLINFLEQTVLVYYILNTIEKRGRFVDVLKFILIFIAADILAAVISNMYEQFIKLKYQPIAQKNLKLRLYEKAKGVDISCYDNSDYYNDFVLAVSEADRALERAENLLRQVFGSITILLCYGLFFITQDILSILFVALSFAVRTVILNILNKLNYRFRLEENKLQRKRDYIRRVFYLKDYAKEIRLNKSVTRKLHDEFREVNEDIYKLNKEYGVKRFLANLSARYISTDFFLDIIYVIYLVIKAGLYKLLSFSSVVTLYNSAANLRRGLSTVVDIGPFMIETSLYIEKIRQFLNHSNEIKDSREYEMPKEPAVLECRNVSFGYDKEKMVLKNVNITVNPYEKVALVGYNGAGKTTLIKLILRLYDPTGGTILLNGIDIRKYDLQEYRRYLGIVFQDFKIFAADIGENVVMDIVDENRSGHIVNALHKSGFDDKLKLLRDGIRTGLTREFRYDGTDLSGGEAQKLAIARIFYKDAHFALLDEPSSALDPISEYQLNQSMYNAAYDKSVIFISHRLSTTRRADRIYMMENGTIIEQGTHDELLKLKGKYYEMWDAQAGRYKEMYVS
jgi:ATP-binding cassette subfamily B protein